MAAHPFQEEQPFLDGQFDIFEWYPYFQSCVRYFVEHAQYNGPVQALATFINIQLPFQKAAAQNQAVLTRQSPTTPGVAVPGSPLHPHPHPHPNPHHQHGTYTSTVSLQPYIRRLVATGFDFPAVLHGFFGDDWELGVRPLHEQERRNYLFAAKSSSWLEVKRAYDMGEAEAVPFLKPLKNVTEAEITKAEGAWSEWLAMQDWMLGPRSVEVAGAGGSSSGAAAGRAEDEMDIKREGV